MEEDHKKISQRTKGIACILMAALGFSLMTVFVKLAGTEVPTMEKAFFRNFVALIFVSILMARKKISLKPEHRNIPPLACRAIFGTIGLVLNFYAVGHLVLADANMLNKLSPFFAILFSIFLLKEKPSLVQILGVLMALGGSVLIIKPGFAGASVVPSLAGFFSGLFAGLAYTFVRKLGGRGEESLRVVFWFSAFSTVATLPAVLVNPVALTAHQLLMLLLCGLCACISQFCITKAYFYAPAKEISVYDYTQVLFAALFGFLFFRQFPDGWSVLGYVIICGTGIGMFFYNRRREIDIDKFFKSSR